MRKFFTHLAPFVLLTVPFGCVPGAGHHCCGAEPNADPVAASVRVDCPQGGGVTHSGSGTVVAIEDGNALVLTNKHVAEHDGPISVRWADGTSTAATWLGVDATADLAALSVKAPDKTEPCPPAAKPAPVGTVVVQVGYPRTVGPIRRTGQALAGIARLVTGARVTHAAIATENGDSGSGVFHNGELVGIVWGGLGGQCSCVALEDVHRFVASGRVAKAFPLQAAKSRKCDCGPNCPMGGCGDNCTCATGAYWKADGPDFCYFDGSKWVGWWIKSKGGFVYTGDTKVAPMPAPTNLGCPPGACKPAPMFTFSGGCAGGCCGRR